MKSSTWRALYLRSRIHWRRGLAFLAMTLVLLLLLVQAIPYGHQHTNPPVQTEPAWDSSQTHALAVHACYGCHSNQTTWPWYSNGT